MAAEKRARICGPGFVKWCLSVLAVLVLVFSPGLARAFDILLGTGEPGSFSHFSGRKICRVLNNQASGILCSPIPAADEVYNLTNLAGGSLDLALIDSRLLYDALNKTGKFRYTDINYQNLCVLFPVYGLPVSLVVREDAGIESLQDVKGKRISAGPPGSLPHLAVERLFRAKGWSREDFSLVEELSATGSQDSLAFCHGTIQALIRIGVHPGETLERLLRLCSARLLDVNDGDIQEMIQAHPAYFQLEIPAETYEPGAEKVSTFGTKVLLVASRWLDRQTVSTILEALEKNRETLRSAHPALSSFRVEASQWDTLAMPLHPGAVEYFQEH
ncbi:MAG: TAXI family TRAP transporter solute-binding subunit [Desulfohalobiaceae bacterium]|nr:TAXI family TRAP transporter solute-binding subunit [Desulfohalobiaceae bacterium]